MIFGAVEGDRQGGILLFLLTLLEPGTKYLERWISLKRSMFKGGEGLAHL